MGASRSVAEVPDQVLVFALGEDQFCVDIEAVDEIVKAKSVSPVPEAAPMVTGVMDLRGETTTIVDPTVALGSTATAEDQQVIIFDTGGSRIGWLVDHVFRVDQLHDVETEPVEDNPYVDGILKNGDEFTLWVDPARVHGQIT